MQLATKKTVFKQNLVSEELHVPGYVLWNVARNGSMFLDGLIPAAEFPEKRGVGEVDLEDTDAASEVAKRCAILAGGERYVQFYSVMLGAD